MRRTPSSLPRSPSSTRSPISPKRSAPTFRKWRGIGLDNRIGSKFLHAGPGFGGSCFPKDTRALVKIAQDNDVQLRIVEAVLSVNDNRKRAMARKVANAAGNLRGKKVAAARADLPSPIPTTCAEAPSIPLVTGRSTSARKCARMIRSAWSRRGKSCRRSNISTILMNASGR
jgi:hypothetical protein